MLGSDLFFDTDDYREVYKLLHQRMMEHVVIIQGTNGGKTLRFLPDYLMEFTDIKYAIDVLHQVLLEEIEV
jgi:4-aminobutyrate aminotransferase-like enzyme